MVMKGKYLDKTWLPTPVHTKISKTGQTRGADDDVIYQNRVKRNGTVLIPYEEYERCRIAPSLGGQYENGYIVLIKPESYFDNAINSSLRRQKLKLGENLLVFYETREQWDIYPPLRKWTNATSRTAPLKGQYVARIPATTSMGQTKIMAGFNSSRLKGAGIRVYEYADSECILHCQIQLELLFWSCYDIDEYINKKSSEEKEKCINYVAQLKKLAGNLKLYDKDTLVKQRIVDRYGYTICPLCRKPISVNEFLKKLTQADGRNVPDLTITEISLFHIRELRTGEFNHRPYNLGWGHHHCNVVVRDAGIESTLEWMAEVLRNNNMI